MKYRTMRGAWWEQGPTYYITGEVPSPNNISGCRAWWLRFSHSHKKYKKGLSFS